MFEAPPLFVLVCISVEGFRGREGTKHEVVTKDSWEKGNLLGFFFFCFPVNEWARFLWTLDLTTSSVLSFCAPLSSSSFLNQDEDWFLSCTRKFIS